MLQLIYKKFKIISRKTSIKKELIGGLTTFFAMVYILPVNSNILFDNGNGIPYGGVFLATALVAAISSIIIGLYSNLPIGIAPGMGINIFFVSTMMKQFKLNWEIALSVVIINGIIFTILAIIGVIDKFIKSMPESIKYSFILGLGVYIAFIGLKGSGLSYVDKNGFHLGNLKEITTLLSLIGILLVFILSIKNIKMSILITLLTMSIIGLIIGQILPNHNDYNLRAFTDIKFNYSQFNEISSVFGKGVTNIPNALSKINAYPSLFALLFMTLSGSTGAIVSVGEMANLKDTNNQISGSKKGIISLGIATTLSGIIGTSPAGGFLESNAGVKAGAKTGLSSIFIGFCFLLSIPLFPILELLFNHQFLIAPILIYVGSMMVKNANKIDWKDPVKGASSFILIITMWFTSSILNGISFGIISYTLFEISRKRWKEVNIYMYIFTVLFIINIVIINFMT